jgi:hypothetical protein
MRKAERQKRQLEIAVRALREIAGENPTTLYAILGGTTKPCCQSYDAIADDALREMGQLGPLPDENDDGRKAKTKEKSAQGQRGHGAVA